MNFSVDNNLSTRYVNGGQVSFSSNPQGTRSRTKTNPVKPDTFENKVIRQFSTTELLYQKYLELLLPNRLLNSYLNEATVKRLVAQSPSVREILNKNHVALTINLDNLRDIESSHLDTTVAYSLGIAKELGLSAAEKKTIATGALFHDFGKLLIPENIVNKKGRLTDEEKRIIDLHSVLGKELLSKTSLDKGALEIIENHHKSFSKGPDLKTQIVTVADIYSALTTERAYKKVLTREQSLHIIYSYAKMGKLNPVVVEALENYIAKTTPINV